MFKTLEQIKERYRCLTFKSMNAFLTESEEAWMMLANKVFYPKYGCKCGHNESLTKHQMEKLS